MTAETCRGRGATVEQMSDALTGRASSHAAIVDGGCRSERASEGGERAGVAVSPLDVSMCFRKRKARAYSTHTVSYRGCKL